MKKINLITGGAGFIGSQLTERLLIENEKVICIDNLSFGSEKNIERFKSNNNFKFIRYDIQKILDFKVDKIWHLASIVSPKSYLKNPIETIDICFLGTKNVLNLALKNNSKILLASSSEIYGSPIISPQNEKYYGNVNCFANRACYAEGKRISETLFFEYKRIFNLNIKVARIFNAYGPGSSFYDTRVIPSFIRGVKLNSSIKINGNGKQTRSFLYISDLIEGLIKLMDSNYCEPLNLGNYEEVSINLLSNLIISKLNKKVSVKYVKKISEEPISRKPCIKLAYSELNWLPKVNLSDGLDKTIQYFDLDN